MYHCCNISRTWMDRKQHGHVIGCSLVISKNTFLRSFHQLSTNINFPCLRLKMLSPSFHTKRISLWFLIFFLIGWERCDTKKFPLLIRAQYCLITLCSGFLYVYLRYKTSLVSFCCKKQHATLKIIIRRLCVCVVGVES